MKFGHNLPRNQVPEWASSYINYKGLKKLIKTAAEASKDGSAPDLAGKQQKHSEVNNTFLAQHASRMKLFVLFSNTTKAH
jgi:SPX domain protein involved in polyphosphate accumulation